MKKLATLLRTGQLFAQNAHHASHGSAFFADHEFFGKAYEDIGEAYDDIIERGLAIGCIKEEDLCEIQCDAAQAVPETGCCKEMFLSLGELDRAVCEEIEGLCKDVELTQGTQNLLQGIADKSEKRWAYLIRRRLLDSK